MQPGQTVHIPGWRKEYSFLLIYTGGKVEKLQSAEFARQTGSLLSGQRICGGFAIQRPRKILGVAPRFQLDCQMGGCLGGRGGLKGRLGDKPHLPTDQSPGSGANSSSAASRLRA